MSPVKHLITYAQECMPLRPTLHTYFMQFGRTLGESVQAWYQMPPIQQINNWMNLQDAFLLRFLSKQRDRTPQGSLPMIQFNGEITSHYINMWRDDLWSDPVLLKDPEELRVQECLIMAYYPRTLQFSSFLEAYEFTEARGLQATIIRHGDLMFEETDIRYTLEYLQ